MWDQDGHAEQDQILHEAYATYCRSSEKGAFPGQTLRMSLPTFTKLVSDLGLLEPQGPISRATLASVFTSYRPAASTKLTFPTFLQVRRMVLFLIHAVCCFRA
ncbi:hypothetical protein DUNSADRAFT_10020 [Dunaliella salina]|uniref:Uncharacterized protein n=1 Tax=Dunaliella salina TaxID=3046 RepID=A0ABQ7GG71_DUNSA|nr:hypothetical protein DUNSADRAFT_10020 [Dunaliella salina]|eukprot:KAF5833604.1 hypothetical protein DUNSADRAFT_10020 [Dunaliella salina]